MRFHIKQKSGVDIEPITANKGEEEILLPAGKRYGVTEVDSDGRRWNTAADTKRQG